MSSSPYTIREAIDVLKLPSNDHPVDLLGVVVSVVKSPPLQYSKASSKVELWITDNSLSSGENACVVLWGSTELSRVEIIRLEAGDVIRFNGLFLQKSLHGENNTNYFTYSNHNEEPGMKWYAFNDRETSRIPDAMETLPKRIQDLKEHYREQFGGNGRLSPLPCRFRSLSELQVSAGLLSNVSVRVTHHELQQFTPMKKRRLTKSVSKSVMGFATVADSSKPDVATMTLVDTDNRFTNVLREARDTSKVLMINNVFTRNQSEVLGDNCVLGEVVLVPSKNTAMAWEWTTGGDHLQQHSMPSTLETESQGYFLQKSITMLACLVDIEISGKLLHSSKCLESPTSFVQGVINSDREYRPVTLHLETFGKSAAIPCPREVLASPGIVQTLCGGIEAKELASSDLLKTAVFDLIQAMLRDQVKFNWTIRTDCHPFAVEHVVLPNNLRERPH